MIPVEHSKASMLCAATRLCWWAAGSSSCLEINEDAACVPAELRGLAAAVLGAKHMGASISLLASGKSPI